MEDRAMPRKLVVILTMVSALFFSSASASTNLSFEQYLSGWSAEYTEDNISGTSHAFVCDIVEGSASDRGKGLRLGATISGDDVPGNFEVTQTTIWSGPYDLSGTEAILVDMRDIQRSEPQYPWGWGMEATLVIYDGTCKSHAMLWNYHEENEFFGAYYKPGLEDNYYHAIVNGADGQEWYRYRVPLDALSWGGTDVGGVPLSEINLSQVQIGISFASYSWNFLAQTLWCKGLVDNVCFDPPLFSSEPTPVNITVSPSTLNLKSPGQWITVHADISANKVDGSSLTLNSVPAAWSFSDDQGNLVAKFSRDEIQLIVSEPEAVLTLEGYTDDGLKIVGSETIPVIAPGCNK
jgi:hypothetical protein